MTRPDQDDNWFEPKRWGYGAGRPIAWQAWALVLAYGLAVVGAATIILPLSVLAFLAIMIAATSAFLIACARKTRGGWRWRDSPACRRARAAERSSGRPRRDGAGSRQPHRG